MLLEDQDRDPWNRAYIAEGLAPVEVALASDGCGVYAIQAAIAAEHARSRDVPDWGRIVAFYDLLASGLQSPVVELNRAVAVAMRDGPAAGLALVEAILRRGELADYHLAHAARADLYRRLGDAEAALAAYARDPLQSFLAAFLHLLGETSSQACPGTRSGEHSE